LLAGCAVRTRRALLAGSVFTFTIASSGFPALSRVWACSGSSVASGGPINRNRKASWSGPGNSPSSVGSVRDSEACVRVKSTRVPVSSKARTSAALAVVCAFAAAPYEIQNAVRLA